MVTSLARLPDDGPIDLLFLLFHGHGQGPEAMQPLARALANEYPQAAVLCLQAPDAADDPSGRQRSSGFQFFPRVGLTDDNRALRASAALPPFIAMVRSLQERFSMPWERTALAGFSQGAIIALEAVQAEPRLAGRVLAFSGRHARLPDHAPLDTTLHLLHGMADQIVPIAPVVEAARQLVLLGADISADILPDIGHELHPLLINKAIEQLRTFVPRRLWREAITEAAKLPPQPESNQDPD